MSARRRQLPRAADSNQTLSLPFSRPMPDAETLPPPSPGSEVALDIESVPVTGELAATWLANMANNRNVRRGRVVEFSRDMLADEWHQTGEALKFDTAGRMVDGQHRCQAVVLAAMTKPDIVVNMLVVRGVQPEAQMVMDTNTRRSAADQLKIAGFDHYSYLAVAAKWAMVWDRKLLYADKTQKTTTHAEILAYVQANPKLHDICRFVMTRLHKHIDIPNGYIIVAYYVCWRIAPDEADEFFARLADGVMLTEGDPIMALRKRLRDLEATHANLPGEIWLSLLIRTWNARRQGKDVAKIPVYKAKVPIKCPDPI